MKNLSKVLLCLLSIALVLACFAACGSTSSVTFNAGENESFVVEVKKETRFARRQWIAPRECISRDGTTTSRRRVTNSTLTAR